MGGSGNMRQEQAQEQVASVVVGSELSLDDILATLRADERAISAALRNEAQVISPEAALLSAISRDADLKSRMALAPKIFANGCVARLAGADGEVDIVAGFAADNARALARFAAAFAAFYRAGGGRK